MERAELPSMNREARLSSCIEDCLHIITITAK